MSFAEFSAVSVTENQNISQQQCEIIEKKNAINKLSTIQDTATVHLKLLNGKVYEISGQCANCIPTIQYLYKNSETEIHLPCVSLEYIIGIEAYIHSQILKCHLRSGKDWAKHVCNFTLENKLKQLYLNAYYLDIHQLLRFVLRVISIRISSFTDEIVMERYVLTSLKDAQRLKKYCSGYLRGADPKNIDRIARIFRKSTWSGSTKKRKNKRKTMEPEMIHF